jgi:hypothetical protein
MAAGAGTETWSPVSLPGISGEDWAVAIGAMLSAARTVHETIRIKCSFFQTAPVYTSVRLGSNAAPIRAEAQALGYSIFDSGVYRIHAEKWLFPQEKATFHALLM